MSITTEHGRLGKGNRFNRERGQRCAITHAAFHLRDNTGQREVEPSQRPVILSLDGHTCPMKTRSRKNAILLARRQIKHGMGNAINRGNRDPRRSRKEFQVPGSGRETEGSVSKRWTWHIARAHWTHPHKGRADIDEMMDGSLACGIAPINSAERWRARSSVWVAAFYEQYLPSWKPVVHHGSCGVLSSG